MDEFSSRSLHKRTRLRNRLKTEFDAETRDEQTLKTRRSVKFSDCMEDDTGSKRKHRTTSILKKRNVSNHGMVKTRSESVNSMAGQGPKDDQDCDNTRLNKLVKEEYMGLLERFGKKGHYVDEIFPPVISSLLSYAGRKKNKYPQSIKWMRISELFEGRELTIWGAEPFKNNISSPSNLCAEYFVQGLNCLKNSKHLLRKMFETQKPNSQGIYFVRLYLGNVWKYMIIDDHIPVIENEQKRGKFIPAFVCPEIKADLHQPIEIWPLLLEKALAKLYSSYQALKNGNVFDFLQQLTNEPCEYYRLDAKDINLKQMYSNPDILSFGQNSPEDQTPILGIGRSLKLFFTKKNHQKVIIEPEELPAHFQHLYIFGNKKYKYMGQCPIKQAKQSISLRTFEIRSTEQVSLSLYQKDQRHFHESIKYQYSWVRMVLLEKEIGDQGYRWIDGRYDNQKSMTIDCELKKGEYYLVIIPEWESRAYDLNLIIRAQLPTRIERKPYEHGILQQGCTDLAQRFGRGNQLNKFICSYNCIHEDMGMIIQNINNERTKGHIRIIRSIDALKSRQPIEVFNREFKKCKAMEVVIKNESHYTVVLMMRGGTDREFFQNFNFDGR